MLSGIETQALPRTVTSMNMNTIKYIMSCQCLTFGYGQQITATTTQYIMHIKNNGCLFSTLLKNHQFGKTGHRKMLNVNTLSHPKWPFMMPGEDPFTEKQFKTETRR